MRHCTIALFRRRKKEQQIKKVEFLRVSKIYLTTSRQWLMADKSKSYRVLHIAVSSLHQHGKENKENPRNTSAPMNVNVWFPFLSSLIIDNSQFLLVT